MRAYLLSAAAVAALAMTAGTPTNANAQIIQYPSINTGYINPVNFGYYPSYSYMYGYNYPGYRTWSYGLTNPYSTWGWSGYRTYPSYYGYGYGGRPWRGYRGWRRW